MPPRWNGGWWGDGGGGGGGRVPRAGSTSREVDRGFVRASLAGFFQCLVGDAPAVLLDDFWGIMATLYGRRKAEKKKENPASWLCGGLAGRRARGAVVAVSRRVRKKKKVE